MELHHQTPDLTFWDVNLFLRSPLANYGETLVAIGERQSGYIGAVAGMSESKSFLERRIKIIVSKPKRWWRVSAAALGVLSLGLLAVAAQVSPPNANGLPGSEHKQIEVASAVLDGYTGNYQVGENAIITVTRSDQQLSAQLTGQPAAEIYPEGATEFFYKVVDAQISFVPDAQGRAVSLVLHQNGGDITAPRIDPAVAEQIKANLSAKIQSQLPTPGSEAVLRRLIEGNITGNPNYSEMSPELAKAFREQFPQTQKMLSQLGEVRSVEFRGVGNQGWDLYEVKFEHGVVQFRIALSSSGIITGAYMTAGP